MRSGDHAGRNRRSVWTVATEAFSESHFAVYPTALIEPCIKAGTSERGVCPTCGAPWVRIVEAGERVQQTNGHTGAQASIPPRGVVGATSMLRDGKVRERHAIGWLPSCKHEGLEPVPATVLDPFFGAGTTGLVADRLGRDCLGIELNPAYAAMAERRINGDAPMFAEVEVA